MQYTVCGNRLSRLDADAAVAEVRQANVLRKIQLVRSR